MYPDKATTRKITLLLGIMLVPLLFTLMSMTPRLQSTPQFETESVFSEKLQVDLKWNPVDKVCLLSLNGVKGADYKVTITNLDNKQIWSGLAQGDHVVDFPLILSHLQEQVFIIEINHATYTTHAMLMSV